MGKCHDKRWNYLWFRKRRENYGNLTVWLVLGCKQFRCCLTHLILFKVVYGIQNFFKSICRMWLWIKFKHNLGKPQPLAANFTKTELDSLSLAFTVVIWSSKFMLLIKNNQLFRRSRNIWCAFLRVSNSWKYNISDSTGKHMKNSTNIFVFTVKLNWVCPKYIAEYKSLSWFNLWVWHGLCLLKGKIA